MKDVLKIMRFAGKTYLVLTVGTWAFVGIGEYFYRSIEAFPNGDPGLIETRMINCAFDGWKEYLGLVFGLIKEK